MTFINITDLIEYLKFGYEGQTIDLIYLFLLMRFIIYPLTKWFIQLLKRKVID